MEEKTLEVCTITGFGIKTVSNNPTKNFFFLLCSVNFMFQIRFLLYRSECPAVPLIQVFVEIEIEKALDNIVIFSFRYGSI